MSLLLDALRRASARRDDPLAERLEQGRSPPTAEEGAAGASAHGAEREASAAPSGTTARDEDDLALVPEAEVPAGSGSQSEPAASAADPADPPRSASSQREQAATQALLQAGARPAQRRRRWAPLLGLTLGVLGVSAALAGGGWLWHMQSQEEVATALGGYRPNPGEVEPAADATTGSSEPESGPEPEPGPDVAASTGPSEQASSAADSSGEAQPAGSGDTQEAASAGSNDAADANGASGDESSATVESTDTETPPAEPEEQLAQAAAQLAGQGAGPSGTSPSGATATQDGGDVAGSDAATADDNNTTSRSTAGGGEAGPSPGEQRKPVTTRQAESRQRTSARSAAAQPPRPMIKQADGTPLVEALNTGYRALNTGDLATAERAYTRARRLAPDNRDALLGAAAVRQRQGATDGARRLYRQVLDSHPRDPHAQAALAALDAGATRRNESTLKMLLRENPNAPALNYALGNVYAAEARWSEARLAYARAAQAAPDDPDYAFNLAVALDHLGRHDAARRSYARALSLAAGAAADFDPAAVRRRLQQLR